MRSNKMLPCFTADDTADGRFANSVFARKDAVVLAIGSAAADVENFFVFQFALSVLLATSAALGMLVHRVLVAKKPKFGMFVGPMCIAARMGRNLSAFLPHVAVVVGAATSEKVARVLATWTVARMTHTKTIGNWSIDNGPRDAVGSEATSRAAPEAKTAITLAELARRPRPTLIRLADVDVGPESENVLLRERRDDKVRFTHGSLLLSGLCSERRADHSVRRSLQDQCTKKAA